MSSILVAIIINLITAGIVVGSIFASRSDGVRVTLVKTGITLGGAFGVFVASPTIVELLFHIEHLEQFVLNTVGVGGLYSLILCVGTALSLGIACIVGAIVKHFIIKGKKKELTKNRAKVRLAKAINSKGTKEDNKKAWKMLKSEFKSGKNVGTKLTSEIVGAILAVIISFVLVLPYPFVASFLVERDAEKQYLLDGYNFTLNGVVDQMFPEISETLTHTEIETVVEDEDEPTVSDNDENENDGEEVGDEEPNINESPVEDDTIIVPEDNGGAEIVGD